MVVYAFFAVGKQSTHLERAINLLFTGNENWMQCLQCPFKYAEECTLLLL